MSYLNQTKWGVCSNCGGKEQEVIKVKKDLFCIPCRNSQKAEEQISRQKKRTAARNTGFKLRNQLADDRGTETYFAAERQALIMDLDFVTSRICRMMGSDERGQCRCYTCTTTKHFSLMQCGHYIGRANSQIRFDLKWNLRPQCPTCNETKHGNIEVFTERLEQEQKGITDELRELSREVYKWNRDELKSLLISYREKLKIIETKFQAGSKP